MRRVTRNGVIVVAAVSGAMAVTAPVYADSVADGGSAGSPGLISGNTIQLPVHVPVNACGNTVNVVGLLNPAMGNTCVNEGGGAGPAAGGANAEGGGKDSPGVLSGNGVELPVHLPVNVSGNSVNVVGIGNPAVGNESVNTSGDEPPAPATPPETVPKPVPPVQVDPGPRSTVPEPGPPGTALAHTGTDLTLPAAAGSAALILAGAVLYRRSRSRPTG
ncbi:chaplin [Streptomyces sp. NPDC090106]|uniref:chaplin n=1 Tax=Streptomyces sp. NPDC090106 TaxID=3365946 RepID=UPI0037F5B9E5